MSQLWGGRSTGLTHPQYSKRKGAMMESTTSSLYSSATSIAAAFLSELSRWSGVFTCGTPRSVCMGCCRTR